MIDDEDDARRPLPVVLKPVDDELLSSWLARHAAYYGVSKPFFAKWLMLGTRNLSLLDHRLGLTQVARLSEKLRCDPIALIAMTFIDTPARSAELICRNRAPQICRPCADRHARDSASGAVPKHWRKAWRVACPACGAPLSDTNERPDTGGTLCDTSPFADVWKEVVAGEAVIERSFTATARSTIPRSRSCARYSCRPGALPARMIATPLSAGRLTRSFPNSTSLHGLSSAGSTMPPLQLFRSHSVRRSWRRFANDRQSRNPLCCLGGDNAPGANSVRTPMRTARLEAQGKRCFQATSLRATGCA
ncbi:TniQ family protein [Methylocystis rosea]|uniref:TniQ family protein n=1 Tax=Methylocystis rosea TaxID=173366 RepID=UPI000477157A